MVCETPRTIGVVQMINICFVVPTQIGIKSEVIPIDEASDEARLPAEFHVRLTLQASHVIRSLLSQHHLTLSSPSRQEDCSVEAHPSQQEHRCNSRVHHLDETTTITQLE
jgi:hypothetical protein